MNGDGDVVLSWEAPEDDSITGYQILRRRPTEGEDTLLVYGGGHTEHRHHLHGHERDGGSAARLPGQGHQRGRRQPRFQLRRPDAVGLERDGRWRSAREKCPIQRFPYTGKGTVQSEPWNAKPAGPPSPPVPGTATSARIHRTGAVAVAEQGIWRSDCPGRFWTVGVSGRSAVVVSSRSPRDRTQQETHTGGSGRGVGGRLHWVPQGQGGGGLGVRRRGERVSCPASAKTRRRRVLVVTSCSL